MSKVPSLALFGIDIPGTVWLGAALVLLLVMAFYLLTLKGAFGHISPEHREMEPCRVWLILVPLFGLVWHFVVVVKLTRSFEKAFHAQELRSGDPGFSRALGLGAALAGCLSFAAPVFLSNNISAMAGAAYLILLVLWWIKVAGYNRKL